MIFMELKLFHVIKSEYTFNGRKNRKVCVFGHYHRMLTEYCSWTAGGLSTTCVLVNMVIITSN